MKIELCHPFWTNYPNARALYERTPKITGWISRVKRIAEQLEENPGTINFTSEKTDPADVANDFRGAAFESFGEVLIKTLGLMPLIGIADYEPVTSDDYGVDGKGIGKNGKLLTVQFKFRSEYDTVLFGDKDHLNNFINASIEMGVDIGDSNNMVIITTADEVFYKDMTVEWKNKVRYIAPNKSWGCFRGLKYTPQDPTNIFCLKTLVDDNVPFWSTAIQAIS